MNKFLNTKVMTEVEAKEKAKLTDQEWNILNTHIEYKEARRKASSVLFCIKKYIFMHGGAWSKSLLNIHEIYKKRKDNISISNLRKIVEKLKNLGLICIETFKKRNVYKLGVTEKVTEKVTDNENITPVENTSLEADSEKQGYRIKDKINTILDTNRQNDDEEKYEENDKDLLSRLIRVYKGINPNLVATKKQLRQIAKGVLVAKGLHGNSYYYKAIQYLVYKKIRYSNQKINLIGAVPYISAVVDSKVADYNNGLERVPSFIDGNYTTGDDSNWFNNKASFENLDENYYY